MGPKIQQIQVHKLINRIISSFYLFRLWSRQDKETACELSMKMLCSILYLLVIASLITGAFKSDNNKDEKMFLIELSLIATVLLVKLLFLIWRKKEILELLNRICVYSIDDHKSFIFVNNKLKTLIRFLAVFLSLSYFNVTSAAVCIPFIGSERTLFVKIGFPLDYKNDDFAYWAAFCFIFIGEILTGTGVLFSVFSWYLMFHCGLRYVTLGEKMENLGAMNSDKAIPPEGNSKDKQFRQDLHEAIARHQHLTKLTNLLDAFLSKLFMVQLATGGLCICCSIYCVAFNRGDNLVETMVHLICFFYNIFDIFMVMNFGNEIKLGSDRLSYSLFKSEWVDRSESIKKEMIIFGEFLMKPQEFVILKLYPLTLATFITIMKSAYSMFNILQNLK